MCLDRDVTQGTLVLVVGPSGAGKDTLIDGARRILEPDNRFVFPRRIITRPADAGGEDHDAMDPAAFETAERNGAFAISWRAHGLAYGVPCCISGRLDAGCHVVVNVSRGVIASARAGFARVRIVHVEAPPEILAGRLAGRRRETPSDQAMRLERASAIAVQGDDVTRLVNDGSRRQAIARMVAILESTCMPIR